MVDGATLPDHGSVISAPSGSEHPFPRLAAVSEADAREPELEDDSEVRRQLEKLQIQAIYSLVEPMAIEKNGSTHHKMFLFLTCACMHLNAKASLVRLWTADL